MTALPPLPSPAAAYKHGCNVEIAEGTSLYTAEQVEQIRRDVVEACAIRCAIHSQYPIENDYDRGYDAARKKAAAAVRALLEKQA